MILIQPFPFIIRQHFYHDRTLVDRTNRKWFKLQEAAAFCLLGLDDKKRILNSDAKAAFKIHPWLIGDRHSFTHLCRAPFHTNLMRTFVYVQITPHPMTCTMQIVQACLPQILPGNSIQLSTTGTIREMKMLQLQMTFQNQRINPSLFLRQRSQCDSTGNICRTIFDEIGGTSAVGLQQILTEILYGTISYFDSAENYYHGFMSGLIRGAGLSVYSNDEKGLGRADIVIEDGLNRRAIIIELKYAREFEELEAKAEEALKQIEERKYALGLGPRVKKVMNYGIAFWKKESCVKFLETVR